jgi:hypothetical protein
MKRIALTIVIYFLCLSAVGCGAILINSTNFGCIIPQEEKNEDGGEENARSSSGDKAF